ncbi:efflux RND transporter periplasmic adaptor subunit [Xylocopilactobacillus apicola]|uniref:Efflux RND transporter periplasmic adaptor subunit n=1 Tax=Xylocopilactobacillus apicola TaxID=2932184 RepID=A0AAU9D9R1_9LACO|nr:HlyD family efflux transporter periplasmic adaptor subunit [Xylocopilactobacillus apicola]BDR59105.1 hypothetical protein XA3_15460 [Xylocopilactobacillus apicola]
MKKRWLIITIIGVIAAFAVMLAIFNNHNKTSAKMPEKITQTIQVQKSAPLTFNGISKSKKTQSITLNQALGENLYLEKQDGEAVAQGDLIATYYILKDYNTLLDKLNKVRQKNAEINNLKKDVQNNSAKITALTNEVNQLNKQITKMRDAAPNKVYAQFDGVLTVPTSSSEVMKPLAEISSNDASVVISVSEYDLSHLNQDQEVKLAPVDSGTKIKGTITRIATRPDNTTSKISTYTAQIKPETELKNGSHVQVTVPLKEIKIPNSAVKEEDKKFFVYKANGSKYTKKEIQGTKKDNYFVVTKGLKNDESIVKNYKDAD